jgi:hypothetical protein
VQNSFGPASSVLAAAAWLAAACASYEQTPTFGSDPGSDEPDCMTESSSCTGGSTSGAGKSSTAGASMKPPVGGGGARGGGANGGTSSVDTGGSSSAQAGSLSAAGSAGQAPAGGGGAGGSGSSLLRTWAFDQGVEGWAVRDQSPELTVALTAAAGAVRLADIPFSATKQFVDVAFTFDSPADLRGRTLKATVQRTAGGFVGAQLYVYGGAWASPGFDSLSSGNVIELSLSVDALAAMGVTPASVSRIGLKLGTGSNTANTIGPTTVELAEVSLE